MASPASVPNTGVDTARRRKTKRAGRERGCWLYVAAEELATAGLDPYGEPPWYRIWPGRDGGLRVRLYKEA